MIDYDLNIVERTKEFEFNKERFIVREASGEATTAHNNFMFSGAVIDSNGVSSTRNAAQIMEGYQVLVRNCVFTMPDNKPVKKEVVAKWPDRLTKTIFHWIKANSATFWDLDDADSLEEQKADLQKRIDAKRAEKDSQGNA